MLFTARGCFGSAGNGHIALRAQLRDGDDDDDGDGGDDDDDGDVDNVDDAQLDRRRVVLQRLESTLGRAVQVGVGLGDGIRIVPLGRRVDRLLPLSGLFRRRRVVAGLPVRVVLSRRVSGCRLRRRRRRRSDILRRVAADLFLGVVFDGRVGSRRLQVVVVLRLGPEDPRSDDRLDRLLRNWFRTLLGRRVRVGVVLVRNL